AYRARAAGEERLEEGQRLVADAAGRAELAAGEDRQAARERVVHLVLIPEAHVLQIALRYFARGAHEAARGRADQAVARVARPAGGERRVAVFGAELPDEG